MFGDGLVARTAVAQLRPPDFQCEVSITCDDGYGLPCPVSVMSDLLKRKVVAV